MLLFVLRKEYGALYLNASACKIPKVQYLEHYNVVLSIEGAWCCGLSL